MDKKVKDVVYIALYASLFIVIDYLTMYFNLFKMPNGGSLSLASSILLLSSYKLGFKKSSIVCFVSVLLMMVTGSVTYYGIVSFLLDYLLGYGVYSLACLFKNYKFIYTGIIVSNIVRLLLSTISGVIVWQTELITSLIYNGSYILPTMIVDMIVVPLLYSRVNKNGIR